MPGYSKYDWGTGIARHLEGKRGKWRKYDMNSLIILTVIDKKNKPKWQKEENYGKSK